MIAFAVNPAFESNSGGSLNPPGRRKCDARNNGFKNAQRFRADLEQYRIVNRSELVDWVRGYSLHLSQI